MWPSMMLYQRRSSEKWLFEMLVFFNSFYPIGWCIHRKNDSNSLIICTFFLRAWESFIHSYCFNQKNKNFYVVRQGITAWKVSKYGVFSGPYFPVLGLNTEICKFYEHSIQYFIPTLKLKRKFKGKWIKNEKRSSKVSKQYPFK